MTSTSGASPSSTRGSARTSRERLKAVAPHLGDDEEFLATYGDGLTDAPLPAVIEAFRESREDGAVPLGEAAVQRACRLHRRGRATSSRSRTCSTLERADQRRLLRPQREIVDWIQPGDELVEETFERLIAARRARRLPATTASSARWTRSRTASGSRGCTSRARHRGVGSRRAEDPASRRLMQVVAEPVGS